MKHLLLAVCFGLMLTVVASAQDYNAIKGSSYAGALGVHDNPASILNTPYTWDVVLFGGQLTTATNAVGIFDYSYLSSPANSLYHVSNGDYARKANFDFNINLLNARISLSRKSSIAFGANIRGYGNLQTSSYNYSDTLHGAADFLKINQGINNVNGKLLSSTWAEGYISYAHTLSDNDFGRLNAGITLRVSRGLSGVYANVSNANFSETVQNNITAYTVSSANIIYGYSSNYDHWQNSNSTAQNLNQLFSNGNGGASFDSGAEYLIKPQGTTNFNSDEEDYYDYDWKIGFSLLDIGGNQYKYGTQSRIINSIKSITSGQTLDQTFDSTVNSVARFNDSLATLVNGAQVLGKFTVLNPMRLVLNIDHYLTGSFYINADLSLNIPLSSVKASYLQVKDLDLITVTPRWETKRYGFYLPLQFNNQNQFWVGAAVKAGPLLLGVHNLANLFGKTTTQNGGGYIAIIIRSPKGAKGKTDKRLNCPKSIW